MISANNITLRLGKKALFEDVNIQKLLGVERIKEICAFPIRFSQLEAAPVAMVAITDHI